MYVDEIGSSLVSLSPRVLSKHVHSRLHLRVRESRGYSCLGLVCNIHSFATHSCPEPAALMYSHVSCNRWLFIIADHMDIPLRDNYCSNPLDNSLPFVIVSHLCTKQTLKTYLFAGEKFLDKHICQH